jgi:hypothetical protein
VAVEVVQLPVQLTDLLQAQHHCAIRTVSEDDSDSVFRRLLLTSCRHNAACTQSVCKYTNRQRRFRRRVWLTQAQVTLRMVSSPLVYSADPPGAQAGQVLCANSTNYSADTCFTKLLSFA